MPQTASEQTGAETTRFMRVQKFCRRAEEVVRKVTARGINNDAHELWRSVCAEAPTWGLPSPPSLHCPNLDQAKTLLSRARGKVDAERNNMALDRANSWATWCKQEWTASGRKHIYKCCQASQEGTITVLQRKDGSLTGKFEEIDRLLRKE